MRTIALFILLIAAVFSAPARARNVFGTVELWGITFVTQTAGDCVTDMTFDWPNSGIRSNQPRGWTVCKTFGGASFTDTPLPASDLTVNWVDYSGTRHTVQLPIKELVGNKILYGGKLIIQFRNESLAVLVSEPPNAHCGFFCSKATSRTINNPIQVFP
jgi:hypothetical protein